MLLLYAIWLRWGRKQRKNSANCLFCATLYLFSAQSQRKKPTEVGFSD